MSIDFGAGPAPPGAPDPARHRETTERAAESLARHGATHAEVLRKVAEKAPEYPPDENLLALSSAAARFTLTNLDSARLIAERIRAEVELRKEEAMESLASSIAPETAASVLAP